MYIVHVDMLAVLWVEMIVFTVLRNLSLREMGGGGVRERDRDRDREAER